MLLEEKLNRNRQNMRKINKKFENENTIDIIEEIFLLTRFEPELTEIVVDLIIREGSPIKTAKNHAKVREVVQTQLIRNWETNKNAEHFQNIKSQLVSDTELLESYQEVLSHESLKLEEEGLTKEQEALHKLGLIDITKDNQLVVYNPVYAKVFNESWVKETIEKLNGETTPEFNAIYQEQAHQGITG